MAEEYRQKWKRRTAANFISDNPTLLNGEPGVETNTGKMKVGDGSTAWNSLDYIIVKEDPKMIMANDADGQSIPDNTDTIVDFQTTTLDGFTNSSGTFTAEKAGYYFVSAIISTGGSITWAAGERLITQITKNSTVVYRIISRAWAALATGLSGSVSGIVELAVSDTIAIEVNQNSGGSGTLSTTEENCTISVVELSEIDTVY